MVGALGGFDVFDAKENTSYDLHDVNLLMLEEITCDGVSILHKPHILHLIPAGIVNTGLALLAISLLCNVGLLAWITYYRRRRLIRNSSPAFMVQVGTFFIFLFTKKTSSSSR
jgi:hypothetical protein